MLKKLILLAVILNANQVCASYYSDEEMPDIENIYEKSTESENDDTQTNRVFCSDCGADFDNITELEDHNAISHGIKISTVCSNCNEIFSDDKKAKEHFEKATCVKNKHKESIILKK